MCNLMQVIQNKSTHNMVAAGKRLMAVVLNYSMALSAHGNSANKKVDFLEFIYESQVSAAMKKYSK